MTIASRVALRFAALRPENPIYWGWDPDDEKAVEAAWRMNRILSKGFKEIGYLRDDLHNQASDLVNDLKEEAELHGQPIDDIESEVESEFKSYIESLENLFLRPVPRR